MKKILGSILVIGIAMMLFGAGTLSYFYDIEISNDNTFIAGKLDMKIDCNSTWWRTYPDPYLMGEMHFSYTDLIDEKFFNWNDVKPGDYGEATISIHMFDNDAWLWLHLKDVHNDDNGLTEPEQNHPPDGDLTGGPGEGELAENMWVMIWCDDGDNIWEDDEEIWHEGWMSEIIRLYECCWLGPFYVEACMDYYIGWSWIIPPTIENIIQSDSLDFDLEFYAEQHRNNPDPVPPGTPCEGGVSRTYTNNSDFDEGILIGVEHETVQDQLQLSGQPSTYPVMWIANAGEDTLSKWDTNANKELARYHTWFGPPGSHGSWTGPAPSRTCVDIDGNCYVANRHFDGLPADVIKILSDDWIDRNGDGFLNTSTDENNDGTITPDEMLPMIDLNSNNIIDDNEIVDERIAWAVSIGPNNGLGRALAIDLDGNIWLGLYNSRVYYKLSSVDGSILAGPISVTPHSPYGALVDKHGTLWGASLTSNLLELDTSTYTYNLHYHGGSNYGIALGYDNANNTQVYLGSHSPGRTYIQYNSATNTFTNPATIWYTSYGVATDSAGNILAGNAFTGGVSKFAPDGTLIWTGPVQVGSEARGTVVDSNDDVWVIHRAANVMSKFNGTNGSPLGVYNTGLSPYTYSDATGLGFQTSVVTYGTWTVIYDSGMVNRSWGTISWNSFEPVNTSITVRVRSSNDAMSWSPWEDATNGVGLSTTPPGQYLQIKVIFEIIAGDISPILYDLTVESN